MKVLRVADEVTASVHLLFASGTKATFVALIIFSMEKRAEALCYHNSD
jgi:hypothetical protein